MRNLTPVENYFRLGDELLRIGRLDDAEIYFTDAQKLAPASPLPYEGLGLLAAAWAKRGSPARFEGGVPTRFDSFLAYYIYAREKFRLAAAAQERYSPRKNSGG